MRSFVGIVAQRNRYARGFHDSLHAIGHEEYPGDQMLTCGWKDRFDVFIHSRQHGQMHRWCNGDWEYYASNQGFDKKTGPGLDAAWSNSHLFRSVGESALRQQVTNHVEVLSDTLASPALFDVQWTVFDFVRGYHLLRAATGVMDVFRLPELSYYFYRTQRDAGEGGVNWTGGSEVFIASHWTSASALRVSVFGNCEQVELRLKGVALSRENASTT